MTAAGIERTKATRFQKGHTPHNTRDVCTDCVHSDGYVYHKTEDGIVLKHRYIWEQHNGEVPDGHIVAFKDGNRQNCNIDNLCLMSREENARRRAASETKEERAHRLAKAQITRNKNIRRDKLRIHWGLEPYGNLVKRW